MRLTTTFLSLTLLLITTANAPLRAADLTPEEMDKGLEALAENMFDDNRPRHLKHVLNKFKRHCRARLSGAETAEAAIDARIPSTLRWHESTESYEHRAKRHEKQKAKQAQKNLLTKRTLEAQDRKQRLKTGFNGIMRAASEKHPSECRKRTINKRVIEEPRLPLLSPVESADAFTSKLFKKRQQKQATKNRHRDAREKNDRLCGLESAFDAVCLEEEEEEDNEQLEEIRQLGEKAAPRFDRIETLEKKGFTLVNKINAMTATFNGEAAEVHELAAMYAELIETVDNEISAAEEAMFFYEKVVDLTVNASFKEEVKDAIRGLQELSAMRQKNSSDAFAEYIKIINQETDMWHDSTLESEEDTDSESEDEKYEIEGKSKCPDCQVYH